MILEGTLATVGTISAGITILHGSVAGYRWFTGNTLTTKLNEIANEVNGVKKLTENLAYLPRNEVRRNEGQSISPDGLQDLISPMKRVQSGFGVDLLQSQLIRAPDHLMANFVENPERILTNITPLNRYDLKSIEDSGPNMVPIVFERWGVDFIGWTMVGYLDLLDINYQPIVAEEVSPPKIKAGGKHDVRSQFDGKMYQLNRKTNRLQSSCLFCNRWFCIDARTGGTTVYKCPTPCQHQTKLTLSYDGKVKAVQYT